MSAARAHESSHFSIIDMELIQNEITEYCREHTTPESDILTELDRATHLSQVYPQMLSGHLQGTLLRMISYMIQPSRIIEVGTFTGYSAINLAQGLAPGGVLHTIEADPELEDLITKFLRKADLDKKVKLHIGKAEEVIPGLEEDWDLAFIDADKPNYLKYYQLILPRVKKGGFILADNALWDGKVLKKAKGDRDTTGIREFNDFIQNDDSVENFLLPFRDGLLMIRKK